MPAKTWRVLGAFVTAALMVVSWGINALGLAPSVPWQYFAVAGSGAFATITFIHILSLESEVAALRDDRPKLSLSDPMIRRNVEMQLFGTQGNPYTTQHCDVAMISVRNDGAPASSVVVKVTGEDGAPWHRTGTALHQRHDSPPDHTSYRRDCALHRDDAQEFHLVAEYVDSWGYPIVAISSVEHPPVFDWRSPNEGFELIVTAYAGHVSESRRYRVWWGEDYELLVE